MNRFFVQFLFLIGVLLTGCRPTIGTDIPFEHPIENQTPLIQSTRTPFQPLPVEKNINKNILIWKPDFLKSIDIEWIDDQYITNSDIVSNSDCVIHMQNQGIRIGEFVFALTVPFNSIMDELSEEELSAVLFTPDHEMVKEISIYVSESSYQLIEQSQGFLSDHLIVVDEVDIFDKIIHQPGSFGIIPFDLLEPRWKVVKIGGISPYNHDFEKDEYLLNFPIYLNCQKSEIQSEVEKNLVINISNRYDDKFTSVLVTGTTALTRATAEKMERNGISYPGEKIRSWFKSADITHISSETPFFEECPQPDPYQESLSFCSQPEYLELFDYLGIDVIELTGNHLLDKGVKPFEDTLSLFKQNGFIYYAGGYSSEEAFKPALFHLNGNKIAFLGCNLAGPFNVWASNDRSGVNACNFDLLSEEIVTIKNEGYLPIVTFQYYESNFMRPSDQQISHFRAMIDAGAVIVSGSQSHVPMTMEIYKEGFIHYGLGNLFFDQMDSINNRREFLDRHIFYDGRYLGTELLTAMLENYAQPRPMSDNERNLLLNDAFNYFEFIN